jgi:uroporphyrin-3 C-methyltransferase
MTDQPPNDSSRDRPRPGVGRLALVIAALALAGTAALWLRPPGQDAAARTTEVVQKTQRRLNGLEDRLQRERADLDRLAERVGTGAREEDSLQGRIARLEDAVARQPGGERVRLAWLIDQAEYFMRIANAQENLAGDSASALTALAIADEHLRDAADPRLSPVRKLVAREMAQLRAVPQVDTEGLVLKLNTLADMLAQLPPRRTAPAEFRVAAAAPARDAGGLGRAIEALRSAVMTIVSLRRTDAPAPTLLTEEAEELLERSLAVELQIARLALLRGEATVYRGSLSSVRRSLEQHFDVNSQAGAGALALVDELAGAPLPASLPDISASLAELMRIKARDLEP